VTLPYPDQRNSGFLLAVTGLRTAARHPYLLSVEGRSLIRLTPEATMKKWPPRWWVPPSAFLGDKDVTYGLDIR
jgi:hypothetical protein